MRPDRLISLGLVEPVRKAVGRSAAGERRLPILMYHSISDDPEPAHSPYYKICTSPQRFAEQMQWLIAAGYRGVTLSEGLTWLNAPDPGPASKTPSDKGQVSGSQATEHPHFHSPGKPVAITFDDGFRDFHTAAFPALQKHSFTATMYLPTAFIGDERRSFKSRECLTWAEVRELAAAGMEFGSHTVNHPVLYQCSWTEIETELRESKNTLDEQLNQATRAFAYPFAFPQTDQDFRTHFLKILRSAGYETCVTTEIGTASAADERLQLKRLPANECDDAAFLRAKLAGSYNWMRGPQTLMKRLKSLRLHRSPAFAKS